jgi:hypothetical protein
MTPKRTDRRPHIACRAVALLTALTAVGLIGPTAVLAAEPPTGVSDTVQVADTQLSATSSVSCPPKTQVQGVGFASTINGGQGLAASSMVPTPTGVSVRAANLAGERSQLTSLAYCAKVQTNKKKAKKGATSAKKKKKKKKKNPLIQVTGTTDLSGQSTGAAVATCPAGTTVRTGGFDTAPGGDSFDVQITAGSLGPDNTWHVGATTDGNPGDSLTAVALCARGPTITPSEEFTTFIGPDPQWAVAHCFSGSVAFGGWNTFGTGGVYLAGLERIAEADWRVTAMTFVPGQVASLAYCA